MSRRVAVLRIGVLLVLVAGAFAAVALTGSVSVDRVRSWGSDSGWTGPLVFVVLSAALTVAFFPGPILAGASGLLFGTALGFGVSITAAVLGALAAAAISRFLARDAVEDLAGDRAAGLRSWVARRGFFAVLYARLAPGVPYNAVNYLAGLAPIGLLTFAAATAVGAAPRAFAYTALGGRLGDLGSWQALLALGLLVGMAGVGLAVAARDPDVAAAVRLLRGRVRRPPRPAGDR